MTSPTPPRPDESQAPAAPSLRDQFAAHAPISYDVAARIYGSGIPSDDRGRAAFFAVWALLRFEWADAMLAEMSKADPAAPSLAETVDGIVSRADEDAASGRFDPREVAWLNEGAAPSLAEIDALAAETERAEAANDARIEAEIAVGFHKEKQRQAEVERDEWRDRAENTRGRATAAEAALAEREGERDRATRNRDMWKGQCERQAEQITEMRAAMVDWDEASTIHECGKAVMRMWAAIGRAPAAEEGGARDAS